MNRFVIAGYLLHSHGQFSCAITGHAIIETLRGVHSRQLNGRLIRCGRLRSSCNLIAPGECLVSATHEFQAEPEKRLLVILCLSGYIRCLMVACIILACTFKYI